MPMVKMVPRGFTAAADAYLTPHILRCDTGVLCLVCGPAVQASVLQCTAHHCLAKQGAMLAGGLKLLAKHHSDAAITTTVVPPHRLLMQIILRCCAAVVPGGATCQQCVPHPEFLLLATYCAAVGCCWCAGMLLPSSQGLMQGWTRFSCCSCRVMGGWHPSTPSVGTRPSCQGLQVGRGQALVLSYALGASRVILEAVWMLGGGDCLLLGVYDYATMCARA